MIIRPPAVESDSQLQKRFCRRRLRASLDRGVHLERYFALGLKVLSQEYLTRLGTVTLESKLGVTPEVDGVRCSTVFFQDHA
jgi:hypothetical protein